MEAARAIHEESARASALSALAEKLLEDQLGQVLEAARAWVLSALAKRLPENQLGQVLEATRAMQDERLCAEVLSALAKMLPEDQLGQVMEAERAIRNEVSRAWVLSALASILLKISIDKVFRLMTDTLPILSQRTRSDFLSDISSLLPVLLKIGEESLGQELIQAVGDVEEWWR